MPWSTSCRRVAERRRVQRPRPRRQRCPVDLRRAFRTSRWRSQDPKQRCTAQKYSERRSTHGSAACRTSAVWCRTAAARPASRCPSGRRPRPRAAGRRLTPGRAGHGSQLTAPCCLQERENSLLGLLFAFSERVPARGPEIRPVKSCRPAGNLSARLPLHRPPGAVHLAMQAHVKLHRYKGMGRARGNDVWEEGRFRLSGLQNWRGAGKKTEQRTNGDGLTRQQVSGSLHDTRTVKSICICVGAACRGGGTAPYIPASLVHRRAVASGAGPRVRKAAPHAAFREGLAPRLRAPQPLNRLQAPGTAGYSLQGGEARRRRGGAWDLTTGPLHTCLGTAQQQRSHPITLCISHVAVHQTRQRANRSHSARAPGAQLQQPHGQRRL